LEWFTQKWVKIVRQEQCPIIYFQYYFTCPVEKTSFVLARLAVTIPHQLTPDFCGSPSTSSFLGTNIVSTVNGDAYWTSSLSLYNLCLLQI